jgi:hypothetical protein
VKKGGNSLLIGEREEVSLLTSKGGRNAEFCTHGSSSIFLSFEKKIREKKMIVKVSRIC